MTKPTTVIRRHPLVLGLAMLAAVVMLFISEGTFRQAIASIAHLAASQEVSVSLRELQSDLLEAESAQRGYLLTQRKQYLHPYVNAVRRVHATLEQLDQRYAAAPEVAPMFDPLRTAVRAKLAELAQTIRLHEAGQFDAFAPENISPLVVWLGSTESAAVTGRVFNVAGGRISIADGWRRGAEQDKRDRWNPSELGPVVEQILSESAPPETATTSSFRGVGISPWSLMKSSTRCSRDVCSLPMFTCLRNYSLV